MSIQSSHRHPILELNRFSAGEASRDERRRVLRHLLRGCPQCASEFAERLWPAVEPEEIGAAVDRVLARSWQIFEQVGAERAEAEKLVDKLASQPPARQWLLLENSERIRQRAICEVLLERSRRARHTDAAETLRLAELAVRVAGYLETAEAQDVQARAWAELGNARRIAGDLAGAQDALTEADRLVQQSGGDPLLRAEILFLTASFEDDRRQFGRSIERLERAIRLFLRHGDDIGAAKALLKLGIVYARRGEPRAGIDKVSQALEMLLETDEKVLKTMAIHNLIHLTEEIGEFAMAASLVRLTRPLFEADSGYPRLTLLRFEWLKARLDNDLRRTSTAARKLEELRQAYLDEELPYEVALVSLDLAAIYAEQGEGRRLRELAEQTAEIFRSLGVARESLASLALLNQAEAAEVRELIAQLTTAVEVAWCGRWASGSYPRVH